MEQHKQCRPSSSVVMFRQWTLVAVSLWIAGCGGGPSSPTTPSSLTPQIVPVSEPPGPVYEPPDPVYEPGDGVSLPTVVREVKPVYPQQAQTARIQGAVLLAAAVLPDGTVGDVTVLRSLDTIYGLDAAAVTAAKQWLFSPGTKDGTPVAVRVTMEFTFRLTS
jgi:TonB family protein